MFNRYLKFCITICVLIAAFTGCTDDKPYYKLNGLWEGQNTNDSTGQRWYFKVLIEHRGNDISAVYSDHRGYRTLRQITYDGESIGFVIDLYPDIVTYFGVVDSDRSMRGTWSFSGDTNNGTWYLVKNKDPDDPGDDDDEEEMPFSSPFSRHQGVLHLFDQ